MSDMAFVVLPGDLLMPANEYTRIRVEKMKAGDLIAGDFKKKRNPKFHRKFWALVDLAYETWEPSELDTEWGIPEKNSDLFRKQLITLAGYYDVFYNLDGTFKLEAKSIAFASMDQFEFEEVYSNVANVILQKVLTQYKRDDLDRVVDELLGFV